MATVAIGADFLTAFSHVPRSEQKKVREFTEKFRSNPTSSAINYEPIAGMRDAKVRTVRIGKAYRAIVIHPPQGDVYLLAWVDHHDEAMAWAKNKRFDVNEVTGALQVVDVEKAKRLSTIPPPSSAQQDRAPKPADPTPAPAKRPSMGAKIYAGVTDDELFAVGLPPVLLPSVRALESEQQLESLRQHLPAEAYEALEALAYGVSVDEALREARKVLGQAKKVDPDDFAAALNRPDSKRRFRVVESSTELMDMLNAPLERWRVFLHPAQEELVTKRFNGPARVLGGAGTGKTVVAMHRARHLAKNVFREQGDRILFTSFNRNLALNIKGLLGALCDDEMERIEVVNLHSWATFFMRGQGVIFQIADYNQRNDCWDDAFAAVDAQKWEKEFFKAEWDQVIQANGISTYEEYRSTPRIGRGTRLSRQEKKAVWEVLDEYRRALRRRRLVEWVDVIRETRLYLEKNDVLLPYCSVIVDEAQDLHPEDWRLLATVAPQGLEVRDNLFIVGDAHQRIYGRKVVLSQLGINVRGRARRLRINYRTTEEIRRWAVALLEGVEVDDLDGGADTSDGYTSIRNGSEPLVKYLASEAEEHAFIASHLVELMHDTAPEEICLVARHNRQVNRYAAGLADGGIDHVVLDENSDSDDGEGVRLATMHRVKGLEFSHMILAGLEAKTPSLGALPDSGNRDHETQQRSVMYVAATRARMGLTVCRNARSSR